jgi:hypothetical protein
MQIRARMSMSADGYVTTPDGWPSLTADPAFVSGESHGIREFLAPAVVDQDESRVPGLRLVRLDPLDGDCGFWHLPQRFPWSVRLEPRCVSGQEAGPNGGKEAGRQLFYSPLGLLHGRLELPETGRPAPTSRRRLPAGSSCALRQT